jgi:Protein of unknown function (DUF4232)
MIAVQHAVQVAAPACRFSQLSVRLERPGLAAGTAYYPIVFTNRSATACSLRGFPGLSSVGGSDGHQIGTPASRTTAGKPIATVVLRAGGVASTTFGQADPLNFPKAQCHPVTSLGLRVYAPEQTLARYVPIKHLACSTLASHGSFVYPLVRGPTGR